MVLTETLGQITADGSLQELFSVGDGATVKHYAAKIYPNQFLEGDEARIIVYTWDNQVDVLKEYMTKKLKYSEWKTKLIFKEKDILANLVARWQFNDSLLDSVGNNNLTLQAGTTTYSATRKEGSKSHDFDGLTWYRAANEDNFDREHTDKFSISFWVFVDVNVTDVLCGKITGIGAVPGYLIILEAGTTHPRILFRLSTTTTSFDVQSTAEGMVIGTWNHILCTFSGNSNRSGMKIYINGVLNATGAALAITTTILNADQFAIGAASNGALIFDGKLDDVRFYNTELIASQITQIYTKAVSERLLEAWLKFDNTPDDSSGNGNNGTWTGTARYDVGIIGRAAKLLNLEYITLANEPNFDFEHTQPFSIACWFKLNDLTTHNGLVIKGIAVDVATGYYVWHRLETDVIRFEIITNTPQVNVVDSITILTANTWYHVVCTFAGKSNSNGMKIYINGVLDTTGPTVTMTGSCLNANSLVLGAESDGGQTLAGMLDDTRIYNRELSAEEVAEIFGQRSQSCFIPFLPSTKYKVLLQQTKGEFRKFNWHRYEV